MSNIKNKLEESIFKNNRDTLYKTSYDEANKIYMIAKNCKIAQDEVINFDKVKNEFCKYYNKHPKGVFSSSDILIYSEVKRKFIFVEFKNGSTSGVNKKLKDSLIIFANIAKEDLDYCRKNFEYIVVYNYDKNKDNIEQKRKEKKNKQDIDKHYKDGFANKLYELRNDKDDELILFGLDLMKDICVSDVHTYTVDEFVKYYSDNCRKYKGIIFDLDGVICHTDRYHYMAWKNMADSLGIYFDEEINNRLRGVSRMESLEIILERSDKKYSDKEKEEFADKKNELYKELLNEMSEKDLDKKVKDTLDILKQRGYKTAIASSSKNAKLILSKLNLIDFFDVIIDGNDIKYSKPDKEVFEKAGIGLKLLPNECLVVEDAASGVEGAIRAGMQVAGIGDAKKLSDVSYSLESFEDLQKYCI